MGLCNNNSGSSSSSSNNSNNNNINNDNTRKMVPIKGRASASFSSMLKL